MAAPPSVAQEALHRLRDRRSSFHVRQMTGIGDHGQRRSRNEPVKGFGIGRGNDPIAVTPDDLGRNLHPMQPALRPWIEEAWLPAETRAGDAVENGEVLVFVGA